MNISTAPKNPEAIHEGLTQQQVIALPMLASGEKKKDAATAAGVCPQTVSEWLRDSHFSAAVQAKREEFTALAGARLGKAVDTATNTVMELMKTGSEATRLKAAIFVLDRVLLQPESPAPIQGEFAGADEMLTLLGVKVHEK